MLQGILLFFSFYFSFLLPNFYFLILNFLILFWESFEFIINLHLIITQLINN